MEGVRFSGILSHFGRNSVVAEAAEAFANRGPSLALACCANAVSPRGRESQSVVLPKLSASSATENDAPTSSGRSGPQFGGLFEAFGGQFGLAKCLVQPAERAVGAGLSRPLADENRLQQVALGRVVMALHRQ